MTERRRYAHDEQFDEQFEAGRRDAAGIVTAESRGTAPTDGILSALLSFMFDPRSSPRWKEGFAVGLVEELARRGPEIGPYATGQARAILRRLESPSETMQRPVVADHAGAGRDPRPVRRAVGTVGSDGPYRRRP